MSAIQDCVKYLREASECCVDIIEMISYPPVLTKTDFVRRYKAGEFGNASPTWNGFTDWCNDNLGIDKLTPFHIRNRVAGAMTWYDVKKYEMADRWAIACKHFEPAQLYISAMAPTEKTLFQGEVMKTPRGLSLFYSCQRKTMREALAFDGKQVYGVVAKYLLEHFLPTVDYEWLMTLLDRYEGHVVEFSTYDKCFGTIPDRKTVFWEVRAY